MRVRGWAEGGWVAIDPPAATIGWVERASLELGDEAGERGGHRLDPGEPGSGPPARAWVVVPGAVVRSGHLKARMPGPPWLELPKGTMVQLVDRPPVTIGRGSAATLWFAVVPPGEAACYVRAEGLKDAPRREGVSEVLAAYLVPEGEDPKARGQPGSRCRRASRPRSGGLTRRTARSWRSSRSSAGVSTRSGPITRRS